MRGTDNMAFSSQIAIINRKLVCIIVASERRLTNQRLLLSK